MNKKGIRNFFQIQLINFNQYILISSLLVLSPKILISGAVKTTSSIKNKGPGESVFNGFKQYYFEQSSFKQYKLNKQ